MSNKNSIRNLVERAKEKMEKEKQERREKAREQLKKEKAHKEELEIRKKTRKRARELQKEEEGKGKLYEYIKNNPEKAAEWRELGRKCSGEARKEKKRLKVALQMLLDMPDSATNLTGAQMLAVAMFNKALAGDVAAFNTIRDTSGEIITQKQEMEIARPQIIIGGVDTNRLSIEDKEEAIEAEVVEEEVEEAEENIEEE